VAQQHPSSRTGLAIDVWRRYRAIDAPLQSAVLSLYMLVAILPALLVLEEYLDADPTARAAMDGRFGRSKRSLGRSDVSCAGP
jgi:hypothetical protein